MYHDVITEKMGYLNYPNINGSSKYRWKITLRKKFLNLSFD